jgi:NADH-quinone oxidoreductase subunit N
MGAFATGFLLFGIALTYGATGSFSLTAIGDAVASGGNTNSAMLTAGMFLLLIAMSFKVSAAPFHFWAPDVYQGAPTAVTAFMSTVVKTAAFAAFLRLFATIFASNTDVWSTTLWAIAALTILLGNIAAAAQENIKRMLAYSSVAHAGYLLLAILSMNQLAAGAMFFYVVAYSVSSLLAFFILLIVSQKTGTETISGFKGLFKTHPVLALLTVIAMLSLAGIPPTAGFFATYFIFTAAFSCCGLPGWCLLLFPPFDGRLFPCRGDRRTYR